MLFDALGMLCLKSLNIILLILSLECLLVCARPLEPFP
jgi:hypothetical protein